MRFYSLQLVAFLPLAFLSGCQSTTSAPATLPGRTMSSGNKHPDADTRENALALLDDLLSDEKHVSLLLIIKRESSELHRVVKDISETAGEGVKLLKTLAKESPSRGRAELGLPPGERATRGAIAKTKKHVLLSSKDAEFEFQLLLTQTQALNYGTHLAQVAAENEPEPDRARELSRLSADLNQLNKRVLDLLRRN